MNALGSNKCGVIPNEITLKRGERQSLVFWTDQTYYEQEQDNLETTTTETTTKDYFLEAVNGGLNDDEQPLETTTIIGTPWFSRVCMKFRRFRLKRILVLDCTRPAPRLVFVNLIWIKNY